jgi:hypothetical protein
LFQGQREVFFADRKGVAAGLIGESVEQRSPMVSEISASEISRRRCGFHLLRNRGRGL